MKTTATTNTWDFGGDFDLLPIRAHLVYGAVPAFPTEAQFHLAASEVFHNADDDAVHWHLEAIRWRLHNPGGALDMRAINLKTAERLYARRMADHV